MFEKYLIDMSNEDDNLVWQKPTTPTGRQRKFTPAFGPEGKDEIGDILYSAVGKNIYYHEHLDGCETFFFVDGEWEGYSMGKRFPIHPGEILHIQPYQGHGFQTLEDHGRVIVMFQSKDMRYGLERNMYLREHHPEYAASPAHRRRSLESNHDLMRSMSFENMPLGDAPSHRRFGEGIQTHELPGLTLHLTVARYETHGVKEVWEMEMKQGLSVGFAEPRIDQHLFWIREGAVEFNIDGEVFTAKPDNLVYVPPYRCFSWKALEDSNMVDMDCPFLLQDYLEELEQLHLTGSEQLKDEAFMEELRDRYRMVPYTYTYEPV